MVTTTFPPNSPQSSTTPTPKVPGPAISERGASPTMDTLKGEQLRVSAVLGAWQEQFTDWNKRYDWLNLTVTSEQVAQAIRSIDPCKNQIAGVSLSFAQARGAIFREDLSIGPVLAATAMFRSNNSITGNTEENSHILPTMNNVLMRLHSQDTSDTHRRLLYAILLRGEGQYKPTDQQLASLRTSLHEPNLPEAATLAVRQRFRL